MRHFILLALVFSCPSLFALSGTTSDGTPIYLDPGGVLCMVGGTGDGNGGYDDNHSYYRFFNYYGSYVCNYQLVSGNTRIVGGCFVNLDGNTPFDIYPNPATNGYTIYTRDSSANGWFQFSQLTANSPDGVDPTFANFITRIKPQWETWRHQVVPAAGYYMPNLYMFFTNWVFTDPHTPDGGGGGAGAPGSPGIQGPQGPAGAAGPTGPPGPAGPTGPAGSPGADGAAGAQGPQGSAGPVGPKGDKGDKGDPGAQGAQGQAGAPGATGVMGATGAKGEAGPKGDQGIQGVAGARGADGAPGTSFDGVITLANSDKGTAPTDVAGLPSGFSDLVGTPTPSADRDAVSALRPTTEPIVGTFNLPLGNQTYTYTISTAPDSGSVADSIRLTVRALMTVVFCLLFIKAVHKTLSQA